MYYIQPVAYGNQKKALDPLKLEMQVVSHYAVSGPNPGSCARKVYALKSWGISVTPP